MDDKSADMYIDRYIARLEGEAQIGELGYSSEFIYSIETHQAIEKLIDRLELEAQYLDDSRFGTYVPKSFEELHAQEMSSFLIDIITEKLERRYPEPLYGKVIDPVDGVEAMFKRSILFDGRE